MTVVVRPAMPADLETVISRRLEFLGAARGPGFQPSADLVDSTRSFIVDEQDAGRLHSWIAEAGPDFVGIVSMLLWSRPPQPEDTRTTEAYIINMYVLNRFRRQGIGQRLIDCCLASAEPFEIRKFVLHSTEEGRRLYEANGFATKANWMELPLLP